MGFFSSTGQFSCSLSLNNGVMNMQITRGQLLGGEAFYFDFKWTSYAIMKMQMTLSSELKCRWDTVFPAAAEDLKSTLPGGLNSLVFFISQSLVFLYSFASLFTFNKHLKKFRVFFFFYWTHGKLFKSENDQLKLKTSKSHINIHSGCDACVCKTVLCAFKLRGICVWIETCIFE